MSIKIALGGDVNFSRHRGDMVGLVRRKKLLYLLDTGENGQKY